MQQQAFAEVTFEQYRKPTRREGKLVEKVLWMRWCWRLSRRATSAWLLPLVMPGGAGKLVLRLAGLFYFVVLYAPTETNGFDSFEHRYIANTAFNLVHQDANTTKQRIMEQIKDLLVFHPPADCKKDHTDVQTKMLQQALCDVPFAFGDLAALAGDHAGNISELDDLSIAWSNPLGPKDNWEIPWSNLFGSKTETPRILTLRRQWYSACQAFGQLQVLKEDQWDSCFPKPTSLQNAVNWLSDRAPSEKMAIRTGGYKSSRFELAEMEKLSNYVDLAKRNREHFPRHSWRAYLIAHDEAIKAANEFATSQGDDAKKKLRAAVISEAYAQHFLHDSFSSGHIGSEYGSCLLFNEKPIFSFLSFLPPLFCSPTKRMLEHTHNMLNEIGVRVKLRSTILPTMFKEKEWWAFGDGFLFVQEADFHRTIVLLAAAESIEEVIDAAAGPSGKEELKELCKKWIGRFPVPGNYSKQVDTDCNELFVTNSDGSILDLVKSPPASFTLLNKSFDTPLSDRSTDAHIPDLPLEGWKFLATWGPTFGRVGRTNALGDVTRDTNMVPAGTFELGYLRPTNSLINYIGAGVVYVPGVRTSIYPLSVGWWWSPANRFWWCGVRGNFGPRIQEPHTEENPGSGSATYGDFNVVLDIGGEIYPPFSVYVRTELIALTVKGVGQEAPNRVMADSLFANGHGMVTFGLMFDLAQIFN